MLRTDLHFPRLFRAGDRLGRGKARLQSYRRHGAAHREGSSIVLVDDNPGELAAVAFASGFHRACEVRRAPNGCSPRTRFRRLSLASVRRSNRTAGRGSAGFTGAMCLFGNPPRRRTIICATSRSGLISRGSRHGAWPQAHARSKSKLKCSEDERSCKMARRLDDHPSSSRSASPIEFSDSGIVGLLVGFHSAELVDMQRVCGMEADQHADDTAVRKSIGEADRNDVRRMVIEPARDFRFVHPAQRQVELIGPGAQFGDAREVLGVDPRNSRAGPRGCADNRPATRRIPKRRIAPVKPADPRPAVDLRRTDASERRRKRVRGLQPFGARLTSHAR